MLDDVEVGLGQFMDREIGVQHASFDAALDEGGDEENRIMDLGVLLEAGGVFALGGEDDSEGEAEEVRLAAGEGGECDDDVGELIDGGFFRRSGFAHEAKALIHRVVNQGLEEAFLVVEVVVERRLGYARFAGDVLHGGAGVTAVGEEFQAGVEQALARVGGEFGHGETSVAQAGVGSTKYLPFGRIIDVAAAAAMVTTAVMLRVAIVGTGSIANYHATQFSRIKGCQVVAACDVDEERVAAFCAKHSVPTFFTDVDLMLKKCEIDAVVVSTPDRFHAPASLKALKLKKHVLCEKPLAVNYAEASAMARAAKRAGVVNMVHFTYRNAPVIHKAHELIASGKLGHIVHVDASYLQSWLVSIEWGDWRKTPGLGWRLSTRHGSTGALGDLGVHLIDFASYAAGEIKAVNAHLKAFTKIKGKKHGEYTLDANDTALMQVEFKHGGLGMLHTTRWATGHLNTIQLLICGTKGAIRINLDRSKEKLEISTGEDLKPAKWKEITCPKTPTIQERFVKSIRTGKNDQPDFARGAEVQKVLDACFESHATGKWAVV